MGVRGGRQIRRGRSVLSRDGRADRRWQGGAGRGGGHQHRRSRIGGVSRVDVRRESPDVQMFNQAQGQSVEAGPGCYDDGRMGRGSHWRRKWGRAKRHAAGASMRGQRERENSARACASATLPLKNNLNQVVQTGDKLEGAVRCGWEKMITARGLSRGTGGRECECVSWARSVGGCKPSPPSQRPQVVAPVCTHTETNWCFGNWL